MLVSVAAPAAFLVFPFNTRRPFASGTKTGLASTRSHQPALVPPMG
jgi:hypothetical protein